MNKARFFIFALAAGILFASACFVNAQLPNFPDAAASDPNTLGWMKGFPPAPDKTIRYADISYYSFPKWRWSFSHWRELMPTANVSRGNVPVSPLPEAKRNLNDLTFTDMNGKSLNWEKALNLNYTDGILVLHKGKVVYERYFGALQPLKPHICFSVTKSFVGTMAAILASEGKIDPAALVTKYLPEMKGTAYEDATLRQVMDMVIGVKYSENYTDPKAEIWDYAKSGMALTGCPGYEGPKNYYEFLKTLKKEGSHGEAFAYKTVNAEILAWVVKRASGRSLSDFLSEAIWAKIGAEGDAYFQIDTIGTESGGGGLNTTLRDLARFGEMIRLKGFYNGKQIIPVKVVEDI
ncbi:MAG TPA: serine hydrolase, partial [Thermodesulfobacteriota bacterium]|nr:serine hydrolase [Thermodesulfobacteriota bacterium]